MRLKGPQLAQNLRDASAQGGRDHLQGLDDPGGVDDEVAAEVHLLPGVVDTVETTKDMPLESSTVMKTLALSDTLRELETSLVFMPSP